MNLNKEIKTILIVALVSAVLAVSFPVFANGFPVAPPLWFSLMEAVLNWLFIFLIPLAAAMGIISGLWIRKKKDPAIPKFLRFTVYVFMAFGVASIFLFLVNVLRDLYF